MEPENSLITRFTSLLMMVLASAMVETAVFESGRTAMIIVWPAIWLLCGVIIQKYLPWMISSVLQTNFLAVGAFIFPFIFELARRSFFEEGYAFELQMIFGLRNMGLILSMLASKMFFQKLSVLSSLALMLFGSLMTNQIIGYFILGAYTVAGAIWLMGLYWSGLGRTAFHVGKTSSFQLQAMPLFIPWFPMGIFTASLLMLVAMMIFKPSGFSMVLAEVMPTSGGSGKLDIFARNGVGDGPEQMAGPNAQSAGMVETEKSIEDNNNSLIDAVSEVFGPPKKTNENRERMIAAGKTDLIENHGRPSENRSPSRDFETRRFSPKKSLKIQSIPGRAIYEVEGKTPLHIRVVAYEFYDWIENKWVEGRKPATRNIEVLEADWMQLLKTKTHRNWFGANEFHRLKFANPRNNLVPTPEFLQKIRIHRVDRAEYYDWDYEDVLVISGRKTLPSGLVVQTESKTINQGNLPAEMFININNHEAVAPMLVEIPESLKSEYAKIAQDITGSEPTGWRQVQKMVEWLKKDFVLNQNEPVPDGHCHPSLWFLKESKSGPDYLFATSAAFLLRALGYPTRVCLGYYASPGSYDPQTRHTPVKDSDLHVWPEILLKDGNWLVLEPTPGFETLVHTPTWGEVIEASWMLFWSETEKRKFPFMVVGCFLSLIYLFRVRLQHAIDVFLWLAIPSSNSRKMVLRTFRVLERRMKSRGWRRNPAVSPACWVRGILPYIPGARDESPEFTGMLDWSAYGPQGKNPWSPGQVSGICGKVIRQWK